MGKLRFALVLLQKKVLSDNSDLPSKKITNLPWFYKSYKQDPTIQSMLNILDAIHEKYIHENQKLFDKLQRLQFYILPLNGFNLTDELYVKMNARGKQLTDFENFKADLIKWMKDECNTEFKIFVNKIKLNGREMPYYLSLSQKIDTTWTDYFWQETKNYDPKEKDKKGNLIHPEGKNVDTLFFQLFCRFFFSKLVVDETQFSSNILSILSENELNEKYKYFIAKNTKYQHNGSISEFKANLKENLDVKQDFVKFIFEQYYYILYSEGKYQNFEVFQKIASYDILSKLEKMMDLLHQNWHIIQECIQPNWQNENKRTILYNEINQSERVVFLAIVLFLERNENFNNIKFKQWMRVVWNIVENTNIDGHAPMVSTMKLITLLNQKSLQSESIYSYLAFDNNEPTSSKNAVLEERIKAKFIINDNSWEELFIEAEKHPFFRGSIGFIIADNMKQEEFIQRKNIAFSVFDDKGVNAKYRSNGHIFLRALISRYTEHQQVINQNFTDTDEKEHYLKKMLASDEVVRNATREWFLIYSEDKLMDALNNFVKKDSEIQGWHNNNEWERVRIQRAHEALYKTPDLQRWMQQRDAIRFS